MTSLQEIIEKTVQDKGLIYTTIGNVGNTLLGALFWFVLASVVGVTEYGQVNYIIATAVIPATIGVLGLNTTVTTFLAKGYEEIVYESNSIVLITSLIAGSMLYPLYGLEASLVAISLMYFTMSISMIIGSKRFKEYAITIISGRIIQIISSIYLYLSIGVTGIIIGYASGLFLASFRFISSLPKFTLKFSQVKKRIIFTLHSYGLTLAHTFSIYLDKVVVGYIFGFTSLGLYQLAFQFLMLLMVLPSIIFTYLLPQEASGVTSEQVKYFGLGVSSFIFLISYILSPIVVESLFPLYVKSIPMIQIISIGIIPITITSIINAELLGREESVLALKGGIIYLLAILVFIPLLGGFVGVLGLAYAVTLANFFRAAYLVLKTRYGF